MRIAESTATGGLSERDAMELIIVRHAEAHNLGEAGIGTDRGRTLTPKGREQARLVAERLWCVVPQKLMM